MTDTTASAAPAPMRRFRIGKRRLRTTLLLAGPLAVALVSGIVYLFGGRVVGTDNAYVKADKVVIAPEVSGRIVAVPVRENQAVQAGDVLFRLDDAPFRIALARADAHLAEVGSEIASLKASYRQKTEALELARANAALAAKDYDRKAQLIKSSTVSASTLDAARTQLDVTRQQIRLAEQDMAQIRAQLQGDPDIAAADHPLYREAKAARDAAALDLDRATVRAPFAGIANQTPKPGAQVAPGDAVMSVVSATNIWIDANFKETDLTYVRPGQPVTIHVDTYPDHEWQGTVDGIAQATGAEFSVIPAQNTTGNWVKVVQRIPVRIAVANLAGAPQLRAGMSATVDIDTGRVRPALRVAMSVFGGAPASQIAAAEPVR